MSNRSINRSKVFWCNACLSLIMENDSVVVAIKIGLIQMYHRYYFRILKRVYDVIRNFHLSGIWKKPLWLLQSALAFEQSIPVIPITTNVNGKGC